MHYIGLSASNLFKEQIKGKPRFNAIKLRADQIFPTLL